jgi:predicted DNA-binding ribbon-helix-helix protein
MQASSPVRLCRSTVGSICIDAKAAIRVKDIYHPPVKRSMTIAGHQTSISLEPLFWQALKAAADGRGLPINALVAQIDVERLESETPCGLASAIRLWIAANA